MSRQGEVTVLSSLTALSILQRQGFFDYSMYKTHSRTVQLRTQTNVGNLNLPAPSPSFLPPSLLCLSLGITTTREVYYYPKSGHKAATPFHSVDMFRLGP